MESPSLYINYPTLDRMCHEVSGFEEGFDVAMTITKYWQLGAAHMQSNNKMPLHAECVSNAHPEQAALQCVFDYPSVAFQLHR